MIDEMNTIQMVVSDEMQVTWIGMNHTLTAVAVWAYAGGAAGPA